MKKNIEQLNNAVKAIPLTQKQRDSIINTISDIIDNNTGGGGSIDVESDSFILNFDALPIADDAGQINEEIYNNLITAYHNSKRIVFIYESYPYYIIDKIGYEWISLTVGDIKSKTIFNVLDDYTIQVKNEPIYNNATTIENGLMSSEDKVKLNNIEINNEKIIKINGKGNLTNFCIGPYNDVDWYNGNYYQGYRTNIFSKDYPYEDFPTSMTTVRRGLSYEPGNYKIVLEATEGDIDIAKIYIPEYNTNNNHNFDILVTPISNNRYYIITGYEFIRADSEESIFGTDADLYILDIKHSKTYADFTRQLPDIGCNYKSFEMSVTYSTSWAMVYSEFTAYKNDYYKYMINWYQYTNKREINNNYFHDMLTNIDKNAEELYEILPSATCDTIDYTLAYARMDTSLACQDIGLIELQRRYLYVPESGPRVPKLTINLYNPYNEDLYLTVNNNSDELASVIGQTYSISQGNIIYNCVKLAKKSSCKIIILSGYWGDTRSMNIIIEYPTSNIVPYTLTMNIADGINDNLTFNNHAAVYREIRQTIEAGGQIIVKGTATTNYMEADARSGTEVVLRYAVPRIDYVDNKNVVKISSYEIRINESNYSTKALHNVLS